MMHKNAKLISLLLSVFIFLSSYSLYFTKKIKDEEDLIRKEKVRRLTACMKLSKTRQSQDLLYYSNILQAVNEEYQRAKERNDEYLISENDFVALTIVYCYSKIKENEVYYILNTQNLNSLNDEKIEVKKLLNLEEFDNFYQTKKVNLIDKMVVELQEELIEVMSLTKEAEIMEQYYYNVSTDNFISLNPWEKFQALLLKLEIFEYFSTQGVILLLGFLAFIIIYALKKKKVNTIQPQIQHDSSKKQKKKNK